MRPLIGITTSLSEGVPSRPDRTTLNGAYIRAIEHAGGVPILLSPHHTPESTGELLDMVAGVVVTGGGDVDPALYGQSDPTLVQALQKHRSELARNIEQGEERWLNILDEIE